MKRIPPAKQFLFAIILFTFLLTPGSIARAGWQDLLSGASKLGNSLIKTLGPTEDSDVIVSTPEDILAKALDQIKLAEKIAKKAKELEDEVNKVFVRIRAYQAMQGAIWYNLGKSYYRLQHDLNTLEKKGGCNCQQFCRITKAKRMAQIDLFNQVTIKPCEGLLDTAETIHLNNKTNTNLRLAVREVISHNPPISKAFDEQINRQNRALNNLLKSYASRIGDINLAFLFAERAFKQISKELGRAQKHMSAAIKKFNEQGRLVTIEAVKHAGILAMHIAKLSTLLKEHNTISSLQSIAQAYNILKRATRLQRTLTKFSSNYKKFAKQASIIKQAAAQAREEISASGLTIRSLRKKLNQSWARQVAKINKIAKQEKLKVVNLKKEMAVIEKKNRRQTRQMYARLTKKAQQKATKAFGKPVF